MARDPVMTPTEPVAAPEPEPQDETANEAVQEADAGQENPAEPVTEDAQAGSEGEGGGNESPPEDPENLTRSEVINEFGDALGAKLIDAGMASLLAIAEAPDKYLIAIKGIGRATVKAIREKVPYQEPPHFGVMREMGVPEPPRGDYHDIQVIEGADYLDATVGKKGYRLYLNVEEFEWEEREVPTPPASPAGGTEPVAAAPGAEVQQSVRIRRIAQSQ